MPQRSWPILLAIALITLLIPAHARAGRRDLTIKFEIEDGATVSDIVTVIARAADDGDTGVDKVEFSVDGQLKSTDTSTPYSFDWDTLAETEGSHTLSAVATDAKGQTASAKITVTVNNELGKGADFHADAALAALKSGDVDGAMRAARRALKIAPGNLRAARALAGIYKRRGQFNQAIGVLEKAEIPDDDVDARADLVGLYIARGDTADSTEGFLRDAGLAAEAFRKLQTQRIAAVQGNGPEAAIQRGDLYFSLRDWTAALREYQKSGTGDDAPIAALNRQLLTNLLLGRTREVETTLRILNNAKRSDEVTRALAGLLYYDNRQIARGDEAVQSGLENGAVPALLIATYADMARKATKKARAHAEVLTAAAPDLPETLLINAYLNNDPIEAHKILVAAMEKNPLLAEAYAARGFQTMLTRDKNRYQAADSIFEFALKLDPTSGYVLMGRALALIAQKRYNEAEPLLTQVLKQEPNAPDAHMAMALNLSLLDKTTQINAHMDTARKTDPDQWADFLLPKPADLIARVYHYRYAPVITPAALYAKKGE